MVIDSTSTRYYIFVGNVVSNTLYVKLSKKMIQREKSSFFVLVVLIFIRVYNLFRFEFLLNKVSLILAQSERLRYT